MQKFWPLLNQPACYGPYRPKFWTPLATVFVEIFWNEKNWGSFRPNWVAPWKEFMISWKKRRFEIFRTTAPSRASGSWYNLETCLSDFYSRMHKSRWCTCTLHIGYNHFRVGTKTLSLQPRRENQFSIHPQDLKVEVTLVWQCGNVPFLSYSSFFTDFGGICQISWNLNSKKERFILYFLVKNGSSCIYYEYILSLKQILLHWARKMSFKV